MRSFTRAERVGGEIRRILSDILRKSVKDPRLEMTVITGVDVSSDLKNARVYFSTSGGNEIRRQEASEGFQSALGYIRRTLSQELALRYIPEIRFFYDESFDYGSRIDTLLRESEK
ncbi:MAG: ribosome-binding factor A [Desulfobacteraceae bacterium IS3]|nr:MAG: ribosome-binding factor A [Desulfobacteraceae bacterium IS3]